MSLLVQPLCETQDTHTLLSTRQVVPQNSSEHSMAAPHVDHASNR